MTIVSLDLETLATAPDAIIASIGIEVATDQGCHIASFKRKVNLDQPGRSVSSSTTAFWFAQSQEAQQLTFASNDEECELLQTLREVVADVYVFLDEHMADPNAILWGNPATFDIAKLEHAMRMYGMRTPWQYYQVGCMMTLKRTSHITWGEIPFDGTPHDCLDDAKHQAKIIRALLEERA